MGLQLMATLPRSDVQKAQETRVVGKKALSARRSLGPQSRSQRQEFFLG